MSQIDEFSKVVGGMSAFCEMISCGAKRIALGHPTSDRALRDEHMEFAITLCAKRGILCCEENGGFLTDLFPAAMNRDKFNILFYADEEDRDTYFALKARKEALVAADEYTAEARSKIAWEFGKLLSYSDAAITRMIEQNDDRE